MQLFGGLRHYQNIFKPFDSVLSFLRSYANEIRSMHKDLFVGMIIPELLVIVKIHKDSMSNLGKLLSKLWYNS